MIPDIAQRIRSARSFLFVPGIRPERFAKAAASGADVVVIDLEDAVAPSDKDAARENARNWLREGNLAMVRINGADTVWHAADLELVREADAATMIPKAENPDDICRIDADSVVPLVETAKGIMAAAALARATGVHRLAFGSIDLATQLGIDPTDREALLSARSTLVIASAAAGVAPPIDGVTTNLTDPVIVVDDVNYACRLGMTGKLCVHPAQITPVHNALAPSSSDIAWAKRILAASDGSGAACTVDGQMVDLPVLDRARRIMDAASC
ncbi:HpcH/HpaI aldolase/citrate lyase family protein (plasmid) [Mycolicibacterium psychrotolerans]|uniref:HpcH/HpaI aldolase/citrate lyase family protein n=1 Tax=Mycolicibacterium psychrotolerans TaxID=216929 RepID=UPI003D66EDDA